MTELSAAQLAYILDEKKDSALDKYRLAYCKWKQVEPSQRRTVDLPDYMPIEELARHLNIPGLQSAVDSVCNNYMKSPGTRRYILETYPRQKIREGEKKLLPVIKLRIPSTLKTFLSQVQQEEIIRGWRDRFPQSYVDIA